MQGKTSLTGHPQGQHAGLEEAAGWEARGTEGKGRGQGSNRQGLEATESLNFDLLEMGSHWKVGPGKGCNLMWVVKRTPLATGGEQTAEGRE